MPKPAERRFPCAPERPRRRAASRALAIALLAAAVHCAGCGGASQSADPTAAEIASIDTRLRGTFRLVRFEPAVPLEPMLASMLQFQYATLVIRFDGKRIVADSPGIHVDRAYQIRNPKGDRFTIVSFDDEGVPYESVCDFAGSDELMVYSQTPPWRGVATIRRVR